MFEGYSSRILARQTLNSMVLFVRYFLTSDYQVGDQKIIPVQASFAPIFIECMKKKKYVIKRSTTGLGMFAQQDIPSQTRICEYIGIRIPNAKAEKADNRYIMYLNSTHAIDGQERANAARYINHSCQPNAAAYTTGKRLWIWSEQPIKAGEEITLDYGKEYFDAYIQGVGCRCQKCKPKTAQTP
jgi:uncharacterized protein